MRERFSLPELDVRSHLSRHHPCCTFQFVLLRENEPMHRWIYDCLLKMSERNPMRQKQAVMTTLFSICVKENIRMHFPSLYVFSKHL